MKQNLISERLLTWHESVERDLPWKSSNDPYVIYVSEILLQQTRVEQGRPYFIRFIERFSTIEDLASAEEDEVFRIWKGLGYYSRARNMQKTAKIIVNQFGSEFPQDYTTLQTLPGIGPYTAAAISSFAFKNKVPVVDGNVLRVVSRLNEISEDILKEGRKKVEAWSIKHIDDKFPDIYNQAIMDLGALICTPKAPKCKECPFIEMCKAYASSTQLSYPVKAKAKPKRNRYFHFFLFQDEQCYLLEKRTKKDIWKGLYQLPLIETDSDEKLTYNQAKKMFQNISFQSKTLSIQTYSQVLSHQKIYGKVYHYALESQANKIKPPFYLVERKNLNNYALPKILDWYLEDNSIYLEKQ